MHSEIEKTVEIAVEKAVDKILATHLSTKLTIIPKSTMLEPQPKMEFAKKLIISVSVFYMLMGIGCFLAWHFLGDWPHEIAEFFLWPIIGIASYMLKSGYENGCKIRRGDEE